ncbi:MAG TPA: hypothetical protein VF881_17240 [Polyangiaceae bacterium]
MRKVILAVAISLSLALVLSTRSARAEHSIIKHPGQHPHYFLELEPHVLFGWHKFGDGPGVGGRATISIIHNGFVSSINNSIGIGFGFDVDPIRTADRFLVPIVMQWNFWLSTHFSVCGEPGAVIIFGEGRGDGTKVQPAIFACGRFHIVEAIALTLRVGWPYASFGVSFLL